MAMTVEQLQAAIDALILGIAEGVQQMRYPDGSGVTYVDAAQAPNRLKILRAELSALGGATGRPQPTFRRVEMRRC